MVACRGYTVATRAGSELADKIAERDGGDTPPEMWIHCRKE